MSDQFEFNDKLLIFLAEESHNCKYGNFLFNSEFERLQMKVSERTLNIWAIVGMNKDTEFRNPSYMIEDQPKRITRIKDYEHWKLRVWKEHFFKFSESQRGELDFVPDS